ncbi:CDP-alcohol phosphatidyltransferase family protein [Hazenella sp. IB182357]|uniref:CDP-diacylglycerol--glycerol-3-phosphate 3-phosphatidyltransferase n=1 Tax=Polycladospora coralii TaxID=2771432 RepID=A0A926N989_9BACL|nr:CDP-alcohol phosphatidyltransferase family protein [Polycladospora coralii]MBD1372172.1 CDP-alcohol phosphatidyltransferase family protein [Polycladospora coralii]MBS7530671.1 CDP-alcohol phosphatidyltransferase family protein [Polycladospora coralii]
MNWPNLLTSVRFFFIPAYLGVYFSALPGRLYWAFGIILLAGFTDIIDGYLARRNNQITTLGIMLDPLADKLMLIAVFCSFLITGKIGIWAAVALFFRDIAMIIVAAFYHIKGKKTVPANLMGKLSTLMLYIVFFLLMFNYNHATSLLWGVICFSYLTSFIYLFELHAANNKINS